MLTSVCSAVLSHSNCVQFFATPWTLAHQAPLSMGFSRREYWSGLPCPPQRDLPDPGVKPASLCLPHRQAGSPVCAREAPVLCCEFKSMGSWDSNECPRSRPGWHIAQGLALSRCSVNVSCWCSDDESMGTKLSAAPLSCQRWDGFCISQKGLEGCFQKSSPKRQGFMLNESGKP